MTHTFTLEEAGLRVDSFLTTQLEDITRSGIQRLLEEGRVTKNGVPVKKNYKTMMGDVLLVELPDPVPLDVQPQDIPLDIVYEDDHLIVVNKPVGLVVHPAPGHMDGTLVNALLYHCGDSLSGINGTLRPGIVHRIDKDTSGLLISAKTDKAHISLAEQLQDHTLYREYETICVGGFKEDSGIVDAPIGRNPNDRKKMTIDPRNGRRAVTHWEVLARYGGLTHVRCRLETGRTHQIRVHMAYIGRPILGDVVYGAKKPYGGLVGQCLHAKTLSFIHPATGERTTLTSELPEWFKKVLTKLGNSV